MEIIKRSGHTMHVDTILTAIRKGNSEHTDGFTYDHISVVKEHQVETLREFGNFGPMRVFNGSIQHDAGILAF